MFTSREAPAAGKCKCNPDYVMGMSPPLSMLLVKKKKKKVTFSAFVDIPPLPEKLKTPGPEWIDRKKTLQNFLIYSM